MPKASTAKRIRETEPGRPRGIRNPVQAADRLSLLIDGEIAASIDRQLQAKKAAALASEWDVGRTTVYDWRQHPDRVPADKLIHIAISDPDPEFLPRLVYWFGQGGGAIAQGRKRRGQTTIIHSARLDFQDDD